MKVPAIEIQQRELRIIVRIVFVIACGAFGIITWGAMLAVGSALGVLQGGGPCLGPEPGFWIALLPANVLAGIALGALYAPRLFVPPPE